MNNRRITVSSDAPKQQPIYCQSCVPGCKRNPDTCRVMKAHKNKKSLKERIKERLDDIFFEVSFGLVALFLVFAFIADYYGMVMLNEDFIVFGWVALVGSIVIYMIMLFAEIIHE